MRTSRSILIATICVALAASCSKKDAPGSSGLRIAVIPKGTTHEFWKSIHAGALDAAKEFNVNVLWKGPPKEDDRTQQIRVVEDFITQKVDGIVLAPLDETALAKVVGEANQASIPVAIIDSDLKGADYVSFIASDNRKGGALAAERLGAILGGKGRVIMLRHTEGHASTTNREAGFLETIASKFKDIKIISDNQYGGPTSGTSQTVAENLLTRFKDGVDGIFCSNESATFGMLLALQSAGLAGKIKFVGFDSSEKLVQALRADQIHGLVVQNPYKMGFVGVRAIVKHLKKETVEKRIDTGVTMVTKENMNEPEVKKLLSPDLPDSVK
jgi:ribose transport system substrate-binding protein